MNPSILASEREPQSGMRPPNLETDRFIAIIGGAFTGVRDSHRILLPRLTNAVYGKIPDNKQLPEEAVPLQGEVVCGTRDEIIEFQRRNTEEALLSFTMRTELWADNAKFQDDLKAKGIHSFIAGFDSRISVAEDDPSLLSRPNRQAKPNARLAPADVEFIRKVFLAAFPGRTFTPLQMAEALVAYQSDSYSNIFQEQPPPVIHG